MMFFVKTPWWLSKLYPAFVWKMNPEEKTLYLSFDDGPHPTATPFVLDELKNYNAKATFFCIGKNVVQHPEIYARIIAEGHSVGNHTQNHLNGWKTNCETYLQNISEAANHIDSNLFRPPYGKITRRQAKRLSAEREPPYKIIMWSVLSGDFDQTISPERCLQNVLRKAGMGSIVVFHDSEKAFERMRYALPKTLEYFSKQGFRFRAL